MQEERRQRIFISAGEVSGDKHSGRLIEELRKEMPKLVCDGLGGPMMEAGGCRLLENLVGNSAMLTHAFKQVGFYYKLLGRVKKHFRTHRPDLVVVVDSPAWNFHVAKAAKKLHIPVLYYIAPQLWAWGAWRAGKLRRRADHVACILPFEPDWFREKGISAEYVGHPLFDDERLVAAVKPRAKYFPTVALLPGSRGHEVERLWPAMQQIAKDILAEYPHARFVAGAVDDDFAEQLQQKADAKLFIDIQRRSIEAVTRHADLALVASGTATLEVAAQNCPMIVMYHVNWLQWHLVGRWLVKTRYISLVNILAGDELVPEFIPFANRIKAVSGKAVEMLGDEEGLEQLRSALQELVRSIVRPGAASNVTEIIKYMLPRR